MPRATIRPPCRRSILLAVAVCGPVQASWVVISEIHYHPPEGDALELVELFTRDPPRVDIAGWSLEGDVSFRFERNTTLHPGESLVIARDPAALLARHPGLARALGSFSGCLGDEGGRIALRNAAGALMCEVRYKDGGKWPAAAGGTGHTLALRDPVLDPGDPASWMHSAAPGGTPGASPEYLIQAREPGTFILRRGEGWRFFRGKVDPPGDWRDDRFDDSAWETGPSGFGFADGDEWIRILAVRTLMGDWDTLGRHAGKNASLYLAPADGRWRLLPWDCDQATQRYPPVDPLFSGEQPAIDRLLRHPKHQRLYLGYLEYLARRLLEPGYFKGILEELRAAAGVSVEDIEVFLAARRAYVLAELPEIEPGVTGVERIREAGNAPVLRVKGTGPVTVQRARVLGKEAPCAPLSIDEWSVDLPIEPQGEFQLELLDFGGNEVGRVSVEAPAAGK